MFFRNWRSNLRLAAGVASAVAVLGTFAAAHTDYLPATRAFAQERIDSALNVATARIGLLQMENNETRLQINQVRRDTLRADKFNREQQLAVTADPNMRQLLQQRLGEIADALDDVNRERDRLRMPLP